jgi:hypothetical protein
LESKVKSAADGDGARKHNRSSRDQPAANLRALGIGVVLFAALWAAFLRYRGIPNGLEVWAFFLFFLVIYVPLTYVALRTTSIQGALRYFFCLTAAPIYVALFVASIVWLFAAFPVLEEGLFRALGAGGRRAGMAQGILAGLVAAIVFWLWFRIVKMMDKAMHRPDADESAQAFQPPAPPDEASPRR